MASYLYFPKGEEALVEALNQAISTGLEVQNIASVEWSIVDAYLGGARDITVNNWLTGEVVVNYERSDGKLDFRYEALLYQYRVELGRLLRMNVDPVVKSEGYGLDAVRNAGIGNATLAYMASRMGGGGRKEVRSQAAQCALKYGTFGLSHSRIKGTDIGDRTSVDVVPPWELLSLPAPIHHLYDLRGVVRRRTVPLQWLKDMPRLRLSRDEDKLGVFEMPFGSIPTGQGPDTYRMNVSRGVGGYASAEEKGIVNWSQTSRKNVRRRKGTQAAQKWVVLEEVLLTGTSGMLERYITKVGDTVPLNEEYDTRVVSPLAVGRYVPTGGFYGRSFVGAQLPLNGEVEAMLENQFQIVRDWDMYPCVVIPATSGISAEQVRRRERRKVLVAEPDPTSPNYQPYEVKPAAPGDFPGKIAGMAVQLQDRWAGQSELYGGDAPGRAESAAALGFLHEVGNINLVAPVNEIAGAIVQIYSSMLQTARREAHMGGTFKLPLLDDRMIGVVVDTVSGDVKLENNPIPEPWEVQIDIMERMPVSEQQEKQEAGLMLQNGLITPLEFRILNEKKGWGFPILGRSDWEAWRKATLTKIILFNDGRTPKKVKGGVEYDRADIMLYVLNEFMGSVEFSVASDPVKEAFIEFRNAFMQEQGQWPDQMPVPGEVPTEGAPGGGEQGLQLPAGAGQAVA
jgi:hypothetical protein